MLVTLKLRSEDEVSFERKREVCAKMPRAMTHIWNELICKWSTNVPLDHLSNAPINSQQSRARFPFTDKEAVKAPLYRGSSHGWEVSELDLNFGFKLVRTPTQSKLIQSQSSVHGGTVGSLAGFLWPPCLPKHHCEPGGRLNLESDGRSLWGLSRETPWESHQQTLVMFYVK